METKIELGAIIEYSPINKSFSFPYKGEAIYKNDEFFVLEDVRDGFEGRIYVITTSGYEIGGKGNKKYILENNLIQEAVDKGEGDHWQVWFKELKRVWLARANRYMETLTEEDKVRYHKEKLDIIFGGNDTKLQEIIQSIREATFHHSNEEAKPVIDEYLDKYPELLKHHEREWYYANC